MDLKSEKVSAYIDKCANDFQGWSLFCYFIITLILIIKIQEAHLFSLQSMILLTIGTAFLGNIYGLLCSIPKAIVLQIMSKTVKNKTDQQTCNMIAHFELISMALVIFVMIYFQDKLIHLIFNS